MGLAESRYESDSRSREPDVCSPLSVVSQRVSSFWSAIPFTPKISNVIRRILSTVKPRLIACMAILIWSASGLMTPLALAVESSEIAEDTTAVPSLTELDATDIPSEQVDQFVSAYLKVVTLIDEQSEHLQRAETEAESRRLQRAIEADAFQLIQDAGLTRQDYFQLLGLANTDPTFRDRVLARLEEQNS